MSNSKVRRVKDKRNVVKRYRVIPYDELVPILKSGGTAFLENASDQPLKRGTVWKAARRLSELVGKKVVASPALYQVEAQGREISLDGFLFSVEEQESPSPKETSS